MRNMKRIFVDTETTGTSKVSRIVELAYALYDDRAEIDRYSELVKPEDFQIPQKSIDVHGITQEKAMEGEPLEKVIDDFITACEEADLLIAHNISFDMNVILYEMKRTENYDILEIPVDSAYCTMLGLTQYCDLPDNKWPALEELYEKVFDEKPDQTHRALDDLDLLTDCYFELLDRGVIED